MDAFLAAYHPKVIHFAVSLLMLYVVLEIAALFIKKEWLSKSAHLILALGVLSAFAALTTGHAAFNNFDLWGKASSEVVEEHEQLATITFWLFLTILIARTYLVIKKKYIGAVKYIVATAAIVGLYFIYETAEHGGELVYKHGVGTEYRINN